MLELKAKLLAQDELERGRAVQRAFIPATGPQIAGCDIWRYTQPANEVGGELVAYLHLNEPRLQLALVDIAGALLMWNCRQPRGR